MATVDGLPDEVRQSVAKQIGVLLANSQPQGINASRILDRFHLDMDFAGPPRIHPTRSEVSESLPIDFLGLDTVREFVRGQPRDLGELVQQTGKWHHQIRSKGIPGTADGSLLGYAHSTSSAAKGNEQAQTVRAILGPSLAVGIEDALEWIDEMGLDDSWKVRLLVVPAYQLHAITLSGAGETLAVAVDLPDHFKVIQKRKLYRSVEFLDALQNETPASGFDA